MIADKRIGSIDGRHIPTNDAKLLLSSIAADETSTRFGSVERPAYGKEQQQRDDRGREPEPQRHPPSGGVSEPLDQAIE
jgi:hypothetical protein